MKNISYIYIMGYSNGQVQSSSDSGKAQKGDPALPGIGFRLTDDGNFDLDGKRLTDVADPIDNGDAATKGYVDTKNSQQDIVINSKAEKTDVILRDGSQSMNANLNMDNKKITNLSDRTDNDDAVNKRYVDTKNSQQNIAINSKAEKTDVILRDGTHSMNDTMDNKKIIWIIKKLLI